MKSRTQIQNDANRVWRIIRGNEEAIACYNRWAMEAALALGDPNNQLQIESGTINGQSFAGSNVYNRTEHLSFLSAVQWCIENKSTLHLGQTGMIF